jgi:hypothetical protein
MSGTPPPNYNPNDSLLSGGDSAKIIPVQGGGSLTDVPNSYNPDASLLSGGETAKIMPVQGGGDPKDGNNEANGETNNDNTLSTIPEENNQENNGASELSNEEEENNGASELSNEEEENNGGPEHNEEESNTENEPNASSIGATEEEEKVLKEVPCAEPDSKTLEDLSDSFEPSEEAVESKLAETIRLNAQDFVIRKAKAKRPGSEEKDEILEDWKSLVFTESEAEFLNTLGLSPKLLFSSFHCLDKDWQDELSEFLYYLTVLTCYPARFVMTKGECQHVREFLEIVESNLKAQQLRKLAAMPIPVSGPIVLSDLGEEEEEEEKGEKGEQEGASETNSHAQVMDRLKGLSVEHSKEAASFSKKVKGFLSKLKFPSLFKKMKEDQKNGEYPEEVNENEHVDNEGNVVNNEERQDNGRGKTKEEIEQEYLEKLRELEIRKATEGLPKEFQTETYRQYINRELRKHGFKEGNFANE